jgi:hypothetical protein
MKCLLLDHLQPIVELHTNQPNAQNECPRTNHPDGWMDSDMNHTVRDILPLLPVVNEDIVYFDDTATANDVAHPPPLIAAANRGEVTHDALVWGGVPSLLPAQSAAGGSIRHRRSQAWGHLRMEAILLLGGGFTPPPPCSHPLLPTAVAVPRRRRHRIRRLRPPWHWRRRCPRRR